MAGKIWEQLRSNFAGCSTSSIYLNKIHPIDYFTPRYRCKFKVFKEKVKGIDPDASTVVFRVFLIRIFPFIVKFGVDEATIYILTSHSCDSCSCYGLKDMRCTMNEYENP